MTHLVVIFALAVLTVQSGACPIMCTCTNHPSGNSLYSTTVFCESYHENITQQLEKTTEELVLSRFNPQDLEIIIEELSNEISLPRFERLTIIRSILPDLINLTFSGFARLKSINLSQNNIITLPGSFLNASWEDLDLSNNSISSISNSFRTMSNLETLNLSANSLNALTENSFSGLESLKCLDLSRNNLTLLNDEAFNSLTSLQFLNLSGNNLETLSKNCFGHLLKLQQLDVSWNNLRNVKLDNLELPSLARLILEGNPKLGESREPVLVGTGQHLQTVDASRTGLKQVPAALTHSIRTLRLDGNSIKTVRRGDLDSYPLLQLLDFNANKLEFVEDDALGRLESLTILYLTENRLKEIPKSLSERLVVLHLERNEIGKICLRDFQGLSKLEVLLLNDNKISALEEEAFNHLASLVTLDISRNPIKTLQAGCLSGLMMLQVLRLSRIAVISPAKEVSFPLSSTEHLITLDLSGSPGLARQLLVDTAALVASRELQELDLSFTELNYIRSDLLHYLPQLRIFHIEGNRINCTQLQWLASWMRRQDEPKYREITCANPPELWGTPLIDLNDNEIPTFSEKTTEIIAPKPEMTTVKIEIHKSNSTAQMSKFKARNREETHPGMFVLAGGILGAALILAMLAARFARRQRAVRRFQHEEVEVSNLPGVTELW